MQLDNLFTTDELRAVSRITAKPHDELSVDPALSSRYLVEGWAVARQGKRKTKLVRKKQLQQSFPDRIWTLLFRMGFSTMSGRQGGKLTCKTPEGEVKNQLDIVAADNEVAIYIECRTAKALRGVPKFAEDVAHIDGLRQCFTRSIKATLI